MGVKLSVIIVSYQNFDCLSECLDSIEMYNDIGDELEVIVSDNSESNDLFIKVQNKYKWVKIIKNKNFGFGYGNNRGAEIALGEYLLFLNPDTILIEPIFKFAISSFEEHKNLGLFGIQLLTREKKRNASFYTIDCFSVCGILSEKVARFLSWYIDGKHYISGANLFVRKSAFYEAGCFDENIFMYYEEPDLIKRIKRESMTTKTAFFKNHSMIHLEGGTQGCGNSGVSPKSIDRAMVTLKYYCCKWRIDFSKAIKGLIRYHKLKIRILKIVRKRESVDKALKILKVYEQHLKT